MTIFHCRTLKIHLVSSGFPDALSENQTKRRSHLLCSISLSSREETILPNVAWSKKPSVQGSVRGQTSECRDCLNLWGLTLSSCSPPCPWDTLLTPWVSSPLRGTAAINCSPPNGVKNDSYSKLTCEENGNNGLLSTKQSSCFTSGYTLINILPHWSAKPLWPDRLRQPYMQRFWKIFQHLLKGVSMWLMGPLRRLSNSKERNQEGDMEDATYENFPSILKLNQKSFQNDGNEISKKQWMVSNNFRIHCLISSAFSLLLQ